MGNGHLSLLPPLGYWTLLVSMGHSLRLGLVCVLRLPVSAGETSKEQRVSLPWPLTHDADHVQWP